ncbi:MAG: type II toxin-antitoxin system HicB family antitoxin [Deltaproteobacteria bacterium]|jgi:predicted RNase H-like HicB family nuclease|nr:type II toxin-antitoxin system HicB family antitoxin [Deltaproteobacteria bacterium]
MLYPIIIHKDEGSDYGVIAPDFPGVFSGGGTLEEAMTNVQDAIETFYDDEENAVPPTPTPFEAVLTNEDAQGGAVVLVNVDFAFLEKKSVPVNITLPAWLRDRIDKAAKDTGVTRSRFIAQAAQEAMRHM